MDRGECGQTKLWATVSLVLLAPICMQKRLRNIGIFSAVINCFTVTAIFIILYITYRIYKMPIAGANAEYDLELTQ
jgi:hypothetical protein